MVKTLKFGALSCLLTSLLGHALAPAEQPEENVRPPVRFAAPCWIWNARTPWPPTQVETTSFFRGVVQVTHPDNLQLEVAASGKYTLYWDGEKLGSGRGWEVATRFPLAPSAKGEHLLTVEVTVSQGTPAILIRLIEDRGRVGKTSSTPSAVGTHARWRISNRFATDWFRPSFNDDEWPYAQDGSDLTEAERLQWLAESARHPVISAALLQTSSMLTHEERFALRELDQEWLSNDTAVPEPTVLAMYSALAIDADERSLAHLHQVFETYPERRHVVATAIARYSQAHRRRPADWRLLVRALPIVEDDQAREVIAATIRYPERATRARWIREALLQGLRLGEHGGREAFELMEHWAAAAIFQPDDDWPTRVAAAQNWFARRYPDQPPAHLPAEDVSARWRFEPLLELLRTSAGGEPERGRLVFQKARCHACHRYEGKGESLGPDLTGIAHRLQLKEMVYATIFPSEWVADEFTSYAIETHDGRIVAGLVGRQGADSLTILQANGEKVTLPQANVKQSHPQRLSIMPHNTLEPLSEQEVLDLFALLRRRTKSD